MNKFKCFGFLFSILVVGVHLLSPAYSYGEKRFHVELFGGMSAINPKDFNLLSQAEEIYNNIYFIDHVRSYGGYFINDFPEIHFPFQGGLRLKYWISDKFGVSLGGGTFVQNKDLTVDGTFSWAPSWYETHTKAYNPYSISLSGIQITGGFHYRLPIGKATDLELGIGGGWTFSQFNFSSTWTYTFDYYWDESWNFYSQDGGTLEGKGSGDAPHLQGILRLSRNIGKSFGFFVEAAYVLCRIKDMQGVGSESRLGVPGKKQWEGLWRIKKEEIDVAWGSATVFVPTNFWEGWTNNQYEREFILDLSGARLVFGFLIRL